MPPGTGRRDTVSDGLQGNPLVQEHPEQGHAAVVDQRVRPRLPAGTWGLQNETLPGSFPTFQTQEKAKGSPQRYDHHHRVEADQGQADDCHEIDQ